MCELVRLPDVEAKHDQSQVPNPRQYDQPLSVADLKVYSPT